ncbi:MAG: translational GTPase TypA [Alphaproteobacteria bacterium]
MTEIRNIAIIAHVDHGKTTLVDGLLKQSGAFRANQQVAERAMDSNDLERERGITILAKCTSIMWRDTRVNVVDTPGHADFGGEVERILSMVDGVIVLVDAAEGPMPQTKFVLAKALKLGLRPIVVINKIDRSDAQADVVLNQVFDLFVLLEATDAQLDFPILYASGRNGWAVRDIHDEPKDLSPLMDLVVDFVPAPIVEKDAPFRMLVTTREYDPYLGCILTGRIHSGTLKPNMTLKALTHDSQVVEQARVTKVLGFRGLERTPLDIAEAGDIIMVAGFQEATVAYTLAALEATAALAAQPIDPPTLAMTFSVNDSPLAGREGTKLTSRVLGDRLAREALGNVAIYITQSEDKDAFEVAGRGELQLGVLIETLRREGFELSISRPRVLYRTDENDKKLEPIEEVHIDVDDEFTGVVVEAMNQRKSEMQDMRPSGGGKTRLIFLTPSRGLIGYHGLFLTQTRGTGIMSRLFHGYAPYRGTIEGRHNGVLIANSDGEAAAYALWNLEPRGILFISPGTVVYAGMIIGEHSRENDLEVNPLKAKQLTNFRAAGKDEAMRLTPPRILTLEQAIAYIESDERVEVTPKSIRLRKAFLDPNERKRSERKRDE